MKILILDDEYDRVKILKDRLGPDVNVIWASNFFLFQDLLGTARFDLIMLDHDLGPDCGEKNGNDAAKYLAENRLIVGDDQPVVVHSTNSVGVANMVASMKWADHLRVNVIHFAWARCYFDKEAHRIHFSVC